MPTRFRDLILEGEMRLRESGIGSARLDAEVILASLSGCGREMILAHPEREVAEEDILKFREMVARRSCRYPLQYLTKRQEFYSLEFYVDERVLIPRPESEMIVDEVLRLNRKDSPIIADIGTGSGNLAVTIATLIQRARIFALDRSPEALEVAVMNAAKHRVSERIRFLEGNFIEPLLGIFDIPSFDFIASNPPYVRASEIAGLQGEIRDHEPGEALVSGEDGLDSYRAIVPSSYGLLADAGYLILEIAPARVEQVKAIIAQVPFSSIDVKKDMQSFDRIVVARK